MKKLLQRDIARRRRRVHEARGRAKRAGPQASHERELKFLVPASAVASLDEDLSGQDSASTMLHAVYFDTPARALRSASMSLRLRLQDGRWTQTFKAPGAHPWERIEDSVEVPGGADSPPGIDPARHRNPQVTKLLRPLLEGEAASRTLEPVFEIDVRRRTRLVRNGGFAIEVAYDEGQIQAAGRKAPIRELELELVEGDEADLATVARQWCRRWGLALHTASKAQRGHFLAEGELFGPAAGASPVAVGRKPGMGEFTAAVLDSCLQQVAANAGWIAAGSSSDEHVHQLRVGIRRLRTALRELPMLEAERRRHEDALVAVFRGLGEQRDRTHVLRKIAPAIEASGGRPVRVPPGFHEGPQPGALVHAAQFQKALLALLASAHRLRTEGGSRVRRTLRPRLAKLHDALLRDGRRYGELQEAEQHRTRKRLKRLRYLVEFLAPLYPAEATERYLSAIKPAQDALGDYNDELMAGALYRELLANDPAARFGVDWLGARREENAKACARALRKLERARTFWT